MHYLTKRNELRTQGYRFDERETIATPHGEFIVEHWENGSQTQTFSYLASEGDVIELEKRYAAPLQLRENPHATAAV